MKSFYTFSLGLLAMAGVANAATLSPSATFKAHRATDRLEWLSQHLGERYAPKAAVKATSSAATADETTEWVSLGKGQMLDGFIMPEFVNDLYTSFPFEVEVEESATTPGIYRIESPWPTEQFTVTYGLANVNTEPTHFIVDATNPDFVRIAIQYSGYTSPADVNFIEENVESKIYISDLGTVAVEFMDYDEETIVMFGMNSTLKDGVITIPVPEFGSTPEGSKFENLTFSSPATIILPGSEGPGPGGDDETWEAIGKARFTDGFLAPGFINPLATSDANLITDPAGYAYEVEMEQCVEKPGKYRLVNPYSIENCPIIDQNLDPSEAYLVIDATDPDLVLIQPQYSGFIGLFGEDPIPFYVGDYAGFFYSLVRDIDYVKEVVAPESRSTLADGVISIPYPGWGWTDTDNGFGYIWAKPSTDGSVVNTPTYAGKIELPAQVGISHISSDTKDAPAEYFNLNGVRVSRDALAPGFYIKRQGDKAQKILVK